MTKCIIMCVQCGQMQTEDDTEKDQCPCGNSFFNHETLTKEEESKYDPKYLHEDIPYAEQCISEINDEAIILCRCDCGSVTQITYSMLDNADLHDIIEKLTKVQNDRKKGITTSEQTLCTECGKPGIQNVDYTTGNDNSKVTIKHDDGRICGPTREMFIVAYLNDQLEGK